MTADPRLTHLDAAGKITMVDVSAKSATQRRAVASAVVRVGETVYRLLMGEGVPKGDVFATARIAGILAAKKTPELIPLCHGLSPEFVEVRIEPLPPDALRITVETRVESKTGVEIDALVGATIAAVTVYDMCKSVSKEIVIGPIQLEEKVGGKSGPWRREALP